MKTKICSVILALLLSAIAVSAAPDNNLAKDSRVEALEQYTELQGLEVLCVKRTWPKKPKQFGLKLFDSTPMV
jgi:hypothetical protein